MYRLIICLDFCNGTYKVIKERNRTIMGRCFNLYKAKNCISSAIGAKAASIKKRRIGSPHSVKVLAVFLSIIGTCLLPSFLTDVTIGFTNSFFSIIYAAALYLLSGRYFTTSHTKREITLTHSFGFLLSCMTAFGRSVEISGEVKFRNIPFWLAILFYSHIFGCLLSLLWKKLALFEKKFSPWRPKSKAAQKVNGAVIYLMEHPAWIALLLLFSWLPCYIALFPGGFSYDATDEFNQQFTVYNNEFPRLHSVLIIKFLNKVYQFTGSYNTGIAIYAGIQMVLFSAMYTHILVGLYRQKINHIVLLCALFYCALFPVIHLTVTHVGRDTLFAGLMTYTLFLLYLLANDKNRFMESRWKPLLLGIVISLAVLSRNNGSQQAMLVLLLILNIFIWGFTWKTSLRGKVIFSVCNLVFYFTISFLLTAICQPIHLSTKNASLSLPSQTLGRAYFYEPEKWSKDDIACLSHYVNMKHLRYCPELADPTKARIKNDVLEDDFWGFLKFWARMGCKCPGSYADALIAQTRYIWYPDSLIDGYVRAGVYENSDKCYFGVGIEPPGTATHLLPAVENYYRDIGLSLSFERIPILSMLFSIGFQFWVILNSMFYAVYRRCKHLYLPMGFILMFLLLTFFVPIVLLRYFMPVFLFFPITIAMTVQPALMNPAKEK